MFQIILDCKDLFLFRTLNENFILKYKFPAVYFFPHVYTNSGHSHSYHLSHKQDGRENFKKPLCSDPIHYFAK